MGSADVTQQGFLEPITAEAQWQIENMEPYRVGMAHTAHTAHTTHICLIPPFKEHWSIPHKNQAFIEPTTA